MISNISALRTTLPVRDDDWHAQHSRTGWYRRQGRRCRSCCPRTCRCTILPLKTAYNHTTITQKKMKSILQLWLSFTSMDVWEVVRCAVKAELLLKCKKNISDFSLTISFIRRSETGTHFSSIGSDDPSPPPRCRKCENSGKFWKNQGTSGGPLETLYNHFRSLKRF